MHYFHRRSSLAIISIIVVGVAPIGCDALGGLFQPGVTVTIENATSLTALPDIRTSDSRNIVEDVFIEAEASDNAALARTVAPNQTVTIRIDCDGDLELITFEGARFQDASGFAFGDADADEAWRRDVDFDCGDTIRIRLSGTVFFFEASATLDRAGGIAGAGDAVAAGDGGRDIGALIDDLLGS